jgi:hypothetical protein
MRTDSANIVPEDESICDGLRHRDHDVRLFARPYFFVSNLDIARSSEHPETSCSETILHSYSTDISAVISEVSTQYSELWYCSEVCAHTKWAPRMPPILLLKREYSMQDSTYQGRGVCV